MKLRKILRHLKLIDDSVEFLEGETETIYDKYKHIEDCDTPSCEEERSKLTKEMGSCLNKLKVEERELDKCERRFYAHPSGQPTPTPHLV